jgi:hypothetical protein
MKIGPPVNNLFLVTSCINTDFGIYKPQQRFEQTIETIASIRKYAPNSKIFIADNSYIKELNENVYKFFTQSCDFVANFSNETNCKNLNAARLKSAADTVLTFKMVELILTHKDGMKLLNGAKRIYRISGRYQLTEDFDENRFDHFGKFVFRRHDTWRQEKDIDGLYITRLMGICPSLCSMYHTALTKSVETILETGVDMEHAIYKNIDRNYVVDIDKLGVKGNVAPNGQLHID